MTVAEPGRRLPGIYFQAEPPPLVEALPRMDIAAFVGIAAAGPLHTPVLIEDVLRFRDIFGPDVPLAWNAAAGRQQLSYLAAAVEAFFRNGGRRCWVVRVAATAERNDFALPGLVTAGDRQTAVARARSAGSWSDELRVATRLRSESLGLAELELPADAVPFCSLLLPAGGQALQVGDLIELSFGETGLRLLLELDGLMPDVDGLRLSGSRCSWFQQVEAGSPPDEANGSELLELDAATAHALVQSWQADASPPATRRPAAARLSMEIWAWLGTENVRRMANLAFSSRHPRFWGRLPDDDWLFRRDDSGPAPGDPGPLEAEAAAPRFPLAGPAQPAALYLPLGMGFDADRSQANGPLIEPDRAPALQRDGLDAFGSAIFLDPDLAELGMGTLLEAAQHKRYLRRQPLLGLHSLLPLDEITLVAMPDAVQPGWNTGESPVSDLLTAPLLQIERLPAAPNTLRLSWSAVVGATAYTLQEAADPDFRVASSHSAGDQTSLQITGEPGCAARAYFRLRAMRNAEAGPWSNTVHIGLTQRDFAACAVLLLAAPELQHQPGPSPAEASGVLSWEPVAGASGYVLEEAREPTMPAGVSRSLLAADFAPGAAIVVDPDALFHAGSRSDGIYYYRVRATAAGTAGPWSATRIIVAAARRGWHTRTAAEYFAAGRPALLAIQRALLRFCAARGDLMALLSLPSHYREPEALEHVAALTPRGAAIEESPVAGPLVSPLSVGEVQALDYAMLYHPWLITRAEAGSAAAGETALRLLPPDGTVAGAIAASAITDGAWIAPANLPLSGVVGLQPSIERAEWEQLFLAQVNIVRNDPRGFLLLSADTLSTSTDRRPINVRRLLILLRRLALREGNDYVFAPNNRTFHRLVQRKFEQILAGLYSRGAFAGNTAAAAFQVVVGSSVNPPVSLDQGRFIVELRVAPARPMAFITVRLVQTGAEDLVIQEF